MGEAKRRKQQDPSFGSSVPKDDYNIRQFMVETVEPGSINDPRFELRDLEYSQWNKTNGFPKENFFARELGVSVELLLGLGEKVWCKCKSELKEGEIVTGYLSEDPKKAAKNMRFPEFFLVKP